MAKIAIDIPDAVYNQIKEGVDIKIPSKFVLTVLNAIKNGTPLPKGHEKLADVSAVIDSLKGIERLHVDDELRSSILNALYANTLEIDKESEV